MAGNYYFTSILGEGSSGIVYRAWDLDNEREVALKVLQERLAAETAVVERFQAEIATLQQLDDPHIITILDSGTIQPPNSTTALPYFATPYLPLGNLRDYLNSYHEHQRRLPLKQALALTLQIAEALAAAHAKEIVHYDVKPENILLRQTDDPANPVTAVLTDFGLSHQLRTVTRLRIQPGSWPYAAPERVEGWTGNGRSDIYSLTVLLYLMLVGQLPYPITSQADANEFLDAPVPHTNLPIRLNTIIQQGMAQEPASRYPTVTALAADLRLALADPAPEDPSLPLPPPAEVKLATTVKLADRVIANIEVGNRMDTAQTWLKPAEYRLLIAHQDERDRIVYLDKGLIYLGRHPNNDVCLDDTLVSAYHAVLERTPGRKWQVLDLDSDNKTKLDGEPLPDIRRPTVWESGQTLQIGPYFLQWQDIDQLQNGNGRHQPPVPSSRPDTEEIPLLFSLSATQFQLKPGETANLTLSVENQSRVSRHYYVGLEGRDLPITWQNPPEPLKLLAGAKGEKTIQLKALPGSAGVAGEYSCQAVVRLGDGTIVETTPVSLTVPAFDQLVVDMHPSLIRSGDATQIRLDNQGNTPQTYRLQARNQADKLLFYPTPERVVTVPNGASVAERLTVETKKAWWQRLWPKTDVVSYTLTVTTVQNNQLVIQPPQTQEGQVEIPPVVPPIVWVILLVVGAGLFLLIRNFQANLEAQRQLLAENQTSANATATIASIELASAMTTAAEAQGEQQAIANERVQFAQATANAAGAQARNAQDELQKQSDFLARQTPTPTNRQPTGILLSGSHTIQENQPSGTTVGTLSTEDPDENDAHTYSLIIGSEFFEIADANLVTKTDFDYEERTSYSITIASRDSGGLLATAEFTIQIEDEDDDPIISFKKRNESVVENESSIVVEVIIDRQSVESLAVNYKTKDKTALAGKDYMATTGTLSWLPNDTSSKSITIPILNDTLPGEGNETFTIELSNPINGKLNDTTTLEVTVEDDNDSPPEIRWASTTTTVAESVQEVTLKVTIDKLSAQPVIVNYTTQDGGAKAGEDFTASSGMLTWEPTATTLERTITISVTQDSLANEGDEIFSVQLSAPAQATIAGNNTATVTITDSDPKPELTWVNSSVDLGEGNDSSNTVTLKVKLNGRSAKEIKVGVESSSDANSQYTLQTNSLTWAGNTEGEQSITLESTPDFIDEDNLQIKVELTNPDRLVTLPGNATVNLIDDDTAGIVLTTPTPDPIFEPPQNTDLDKPTESIFDLRLRSEPTGNITVKLEVQDKDGSSNDACKIKTSNNSATPSSSLDLTFSDMSWATPVPITIEAQEDDDAADEICVIGVKSIGGDSKYNDLVEATLPTATVDVIDDDKTQVAVSATSPDMSSINEPDGQASFFLKLGTRPIQNVKVTLRIASGDEACGFPNGSGNSLKNTLSITFKNNDTSDTWQDWDGHNITIKAQNDDDAVDTVCVIGVSAIETNDPEYMDIDFPISELTRVTITDNDTQGVTFSSTSLQIDEGSSGNFTISLNSKPVLNPSETDVTIKLSSSLPICAVSPLIVNISPNDWRTGKNVAITIAANTISQDVNCTISISSISGGDYSELSSTPTLGVTVINMP